MLAHIHVLPSLSQWVAWAIWRPADNIWRRLSPHSSLRVSESPAPRVVTPHWAVLRLHLQFPFGCYKVNIEHCCLQQRVSQGRVRVPSDVIQWSWWTKCLSFLITVAFINPQFWFSNKGRGLYTHNHYCKFVFLFHIRLTFVTVVRAGFRHQQKNVFKG